MEKRWILVYDNYTALSKKAVNTLSATVSDYLRYVLPVKHVTALTKEDFDSNIITIGQSKTNPIIAKCEELDLIDKAQNEQGYAIFVGKNPYCEDALTIAISGTDEYGVLYGAIDFCNKYCGSVVYRRGYLYGDNYFKEPFNVADMPFWRYSCAPAIKTRAVWTWGHVIYDYKNYFDNMLRLKMNEVVIWNDYVPLNAQDVVAYAHSLGIKVIWGFAWGWSTTCESFAEGLNDELLASIKKNVYETYETQYANAGGDGIYFQSFTELNKDDVGGKSIAEMVTDLVNDVAGGLLEKYPTLHIQFGLHATSVKTRLDVMKNVDKRIHIIWEDCGSFPYAYNVHDVKAFDETLDFTEKLLSLRGEDEAFGTVLKGMLNLDWLTFEHFSAPYVLGERTSHFLDDYKKLKDKAWKIIQSAWLKNSDYARRMIEKIATKGNNPIVEVLVENGMLEGGIPFPVALFAEFLWSPCKSTDEITEEVAKYPFVEFKNF